MCSAHDCMTAALCLCALCTSVCHAVVCVFAHMYAFRLGVRACSCVYSELVFAVVKLCAVQTCILVQLLELCKCVPCCGLYSKLCMVPSSTAKAPSVKLSRILIGLAMSKSAPQKPCCYCIPLSSSQVPAVDDQLDGNRGRQPCCGVALSQRHSGLCVTPSAVCLQI